MAKNNLQLDWIGRLGVMSGFSPVELYIMMRKSPKSFAQLATSHGFRPPPGPTKEDVKKAFEPSWRGKYKLPTAKEMVTDFGKVRNPQKTEKLEEDPTRGYRRGWEDVWEWLQSLPRRNIRAPIPQGNAPSVEKKDPAASPASTQTVDELNRAMVNEQRARETMKGGPPPMGVGQSGDSGKGPPVLPANRWDPLSSANTGVEVATQDEGEKKKSSDAALIGAALSGIKGIPNPNPPPAAGVVSPQSPAMMDSLQTLERLGLLKLGGPRKTLRETIG